MSFSPISPVLVHRRFDDVDELAVAARHWDFDFLQLDGGAFEGEIFQAVAGHVLLSEGRFGRKLKQEGSSPGGMRTFAIPATPNVRFKWRRYEVVPNDILVFPRNGELHAVSQPDFHVFTISLPESLLHEVAELSGVVRLSKLLRRERIHCSLPVMDRLRRSVHRVIRAGKVDAQLLADPALQNEMQFEIPRMLVKALVAWDTSTGVFAARRRDRAIKQAEAYVAQFAHRPITVRDVCLAAKVSERTLQYGFLEYFGVTPKAYLTAVRLTGVRRELKEADPCSESVNEIAGRWGFWHMGSFAADYRRQFGELPSQTLTGVACRHHLQRRDAR